MDMSSALACIEVGGSGSQTVVFDGDGIARFVGGAVPDGDQLAIAVPGIVERGRVVAASNLGWFDVDPAEALRLGRHAELVLNDGEAQALGEAELRGVDDLTLVALGTGIGGAVVAQGAVVRDNLFGHARTYSTRTCACGEIGCLETVAAGWALPDPVGRELVEPIAAALADAIRREAPLGLVVLSGGIAVRYPDIVEAVAALLPEHTIESTAAPTGAKSAAAWGLRRALRHGAHR
ncbi:MAG TPA: ROK family protein [Acidimicrobiales bacterium]|nr:ROK family protein [Acidimicrobiales bacterium]